MRIVLFVKGVKVFSGSSLPSISALPDNNYIKKERGVKGGWKVL